MNKVKLSSIKIVMFDLDGTIYCGNKLISGANEVVQLFREKGINVFFTTNNSAKTRQQIYEKLISMEVKCRLQEILTSSYIAAEYCKINRLQNVYVFGTDDLKREIFSKGVSVVNEENADILLIGYDMNATYEGLTKAVRVACKASHIVGCNRERMYPGQDGKIYPGCGAMTSAVEWCSNKKCDVILGKPSTMFVDIICNQYGVEKKNILVVGDTYESDVMMAKTAGCQAVWITSNIEADVPVIVSISELWNVIER